MATEESGDGRRDRRSSLFLTGNHAALSGWTEIIPTYDRFLRFLFNCDTYYFNIKIV